MAFDKEQKEKVMQEQDLKEEIMKMPNEIRQDYFTYIDNHKYLPEYI